MHSLWQRSSSFALQVIHRSLAFQTNLLCLCPHNVCDLFKNARVITSYSTVANTTEGKVDTFKKSKRRWPRQASIEVEAVTPPSTTSVASTSSATLLKDLFRGQIHLELFDFPELESRDQVTSVNLLHERIKHAILRIDSTKVDHKNTLHQEAIADLLRHKLFGLRVDRGFGGQGLTHTQAARVWETAALDGAVFALLDGHNSLAAHALSIGGTEEQKRKFLPRLASGEHIAAFCFHETSSGSDMNALTMQAVSMDGGKTYVLNGEKTWVTNGAIATCFIVFSRVQSPAVCKDGSDISAFVVERTTPGIHSTDTLDTLGMRGANVTNLIFNNVQVPVANLLGGVGGGIKLAQDVVNRERLDIATACVGLLRYLISYATEQCLQRHQFGRPIGDYGLVQSKLAQMALDVYASESAVFYLTGLLDAQPQRDLTLEMAALKVFASEALWSGVNGCVQLCGRMGLLKDVPFERYLRDARSLLIHGGTNEVLRILLAGSGVQDVSPDVQEMATKLRFSTRHPITLLRTSMRLNARRKGRLVSLVGAGPKVTEGGASPKLKDHVHPNLAESATNLAVFTQRFQSLVEALLITYGAGLVENQMALERVSNCAINLLLIPIVLGRASRSISIGVHMHDYEVRLAATFAKAALRLVEASLMDLSDWDRDRHRIASEVLSHRGYPVSHPLTRVW